VTGLGKLSPKEEDDLFFNVWQIGGKTINSTVMNLLKDKKEIQFPLFFFSQFPLFQEKHQTQSKSSTFRFLLLCKVLLEKVSN
jgi:hypothetical protein